MKLVFKRKYVSVSPPGNGLLLALEWKPKTGRESDEKIQANIWTDRQMDGLTAAWD